MSSESDVSESDNSLPTTNTVEITTSTNNDGATKETTTQSKKRGRPQSCPTLDDYKDLIVKLFSDDDIPIIDIARRLNLEHGLDISERTISRRLTAWGIPRKKQRVPPTQELHDRIIFHYNKNLNDEQIAQALRTEGYEIKPRNLARIRQKLGMRRRSRFPEFREYSDGDGDAPEGAAPVAKPRSRPKKKRAKISHNSALIPKVTAFVQNHMSNYDGSHDFNHVRRVVGLAHLIYREIREQRERSPLFDEEEDLDLHVITLAALLHDVGDRKYLQPGQDGSTLVLSTLLSFGAPEELAIKVQRIVLGVSYSSEVKDPATVAGLIQRYPELAVVQDADRLDAIGAVGIGRVFTYGGAKTTRSMADSLAHFDQKLEKLENMMKTAPGKKLARQRTERLKIFKAWWAEEQKEAEGILRRS